MILADENISIEIIKSLREATINVYSIFENNRGISDSEVIKLSKSPPRIILTEDKDFGEWVFAHNMKSISVIFLRYKYSEQEEIIKVLKYLIQTEGDRLFGMFITVTTNKIRFRRI